MPSLSYLLTYRESDAVRRANLLAVLEWLGQFADTEVVLVEQDALPRLQAPLPAYVSAIFAYNPGPFNRSWGLNVAFRGAHANLLACADADVLMEPEGLRAAVQAGQRAEAVKPYRTLHDVDAAGSEKVRAAAADVGKVDLSGHLTSRADQGEHVNFGGGLFLIRRDVYHRIGGFDERFVGWGGEDDAMTLKLRRLGVGLAEANDRVAWHLWHPRSTQTTSGQPHYHANLALLEDYRRATPVQLERLAEIQRQLNGHRDKFRPQN
jgi:hypothetical protein